MTYRGVCYGGPLDGKVFERNDEKFKHVDGDKAFLYKWRNCGLRPNDGFWQLIRK